MIRRSAAWVVGVVAVTAALATVGLLVPGHAVYAAAAAALVLAVGLTIYEPVALPVLAMPALVVIERVGGGGFDLSISDVALFGAFWLALFLAPLPFSRPMRSMLWLSAAYQVATLFTVVVNPYQANTVEWFHAWLSVGGALVVGWAVGRAGRARLGLTLFLGACLGISALTLLVAARQLVTGVTGPVYLEWPYPMHKNLIGAVVAFAALVAYARPWWVGWPRWFAQSAFWLCSLAVLASQARQALVGLAVGVILITLRADPDRKRSKLVLLAAVPAIYFVWGAVQEQLAEDNEFNSANQRLAWYQDAIEVWQSSPWFGVGLRWWTADRTDFVFQPPNAELEMLSSAGVVGLAGFLTLFLGALVVLWRIDPRFGTLALSILLMRLIQGQFDLFWTAVVVSVPFAVIGICLGAEDYARVRHEARVRTGSAMPGDDLRSVQEMAAR